MLKCRMVDAVVWAIVEGKSHGIGFEEVTEEEWRRWIAADDRENRPEGHPDGWLTKKDAYRNPTDEAAALQRWVDKHPDKAKRYS